MDYQKFTPLIKRLTIFAVDFIFHHVSFSFVFNVPTISHCPHQSNCRIFEQNPSPPPNLWGARMHSSRMRIVCCSGLLRGVCSLGRGGGLFASWDRGCVLLGMSAPGGCLPDNPFPCGQKITCKYITLPELRCGRSKNQKQPLR